MQEDAIKKNIREGILGDKSALNKVPTRQELQVNRCISCMCYSVKYHLYFACTKNFKLLVLNEYLNIVAELPLEVRLVQDCIFLDETQQLITAGVKGCYLIQLTIDYKYDPRQAILLDAKGNSINVNIGWNDEEKQGHDGYYKFQDIAKGWVRGMKMDQKEGFFVAWNKQGCNFYEFDTKEKPERNTKPKVIFTDLVPNDQKITDILLYNSLHYFVIATHIGHLLVFKWDPNQGTKQSMHTFKSHSRAVTSLKVIEKSESSFVSASMDGTIRIWCLDKLIELYCFDLVQGGLNCGTGGLGDQMTHIELLNERIFALFFRGHQNMIEIGQISHLAHSYYISKPKILTLSKAFTNY